MDEQTLKQIDICLEIINRLNAQDELTGCFLNATWLKLSDLIKQLPSSYRTSKVLRVINDVITYDCDLPLTNSESKTA